MTQPWGGGGLRRGGSSLEEEESAGGSRCLCPRTTGGSMRCRASGGSSSNEPRGDSHLREPSTVRGGGVQAGALAGALEATHATPWPLRAVLLAPRCPSWPKEQQYLMP